MSDPPDKGDISTSSSILGTPLQILPNVHQNGSVPESISGLGMGLEVIKLQLAREIDQFHRECLKLSYCTRTKATMYIVFNNISKVIIIVGSLTIGLLGTSGHYIGLVSTILAFSIAVIKSLIIIFSVESRSFAMKKGSQKLLKIAREIRSLKSSGLELVQIRERIEKYHNEVDDIELKLLKPDPDRDQEPGLPENRV